MSPWPRVFISSRTGWIYVMDKAESEPRRAAAISGRYYVSRDMG